MVIFGGGQWGWLYEFPRIVILFVVVHSMVIGSGGVEGGS